MKRSNSYIYKIAVSVLVVFLSFLAADTVACAQDRLEARRVEIRRLYEEAERLSERGSYDEAIENYNKAIRLTKDEDIRKFIKNAKDEAQEKKVADRKRLKELVEEKKRVEKGIEEKNLQAQTSEEEARDSRGDSLKAQGSKTALPFPGLYPGGWPKRSRSFVRSGHLEKQLSGRFRHRTRPGGFCLSGHA